jgi:REP element-mobilizing transposase RayT
MKAIFEFNLPEDQVEYEVMSQSMKTKSFLWQFSQQLRNWQKYGHDFTDSSDALDTIRKEFYRLIDEYEVKIDL